MPLTFKPRSPPLENAHSLLHGRPLRFSRDGLNLKRRAWKFRRLGFDRCIDAHARQSAPDHPTGKV